MHGEVIAPSSPRGEVGYESFARLKEPPYPITASVSFAYHGALSVCATKNPLSTWTLLSAVAASEFSSHQKVPHLDRILNGAMWSFLFPILVHENAPILFCASALAAGLGGHAGAVYQGSSNLKARALCLLPLFATTAWELMGNTSYLKTAYHATYIAAMAIGPTAITSIASKITRITYSETTLKIKRALWSPMLRIQAAVDPWIPCRRKAE